LPLFWDILEEVHLFKKTPLLSRVLLVPYKSALKRNQAGSEWERC